MLKQLHDFIKENYEQGNYQAVRKEYLNWKKSTAVVEDDYQLGFQAALADYKTHHVFRHYPTSIVNFSNHITNNKMAEVTDFIRGYNHGRQTLE